MNENLHSFINSFIQWCSEFHEADTYPKFILKSK